jgi:hypothetical protein
MGPIRGAQPQARLEIAAATPTRRPRFGAADAAAIAGRAIAGRLSLGMKIAIGLDTNRI